MQIDIEKNCYTCKRYELDNSCKYQNTEQILRLEAGESCPFWLIRDTDINKFVKEIKRKLEAKCK